MKIEISDKLYKDYYEYIKKVFLTEDISNHIENLLVGELTGRAWPGYEIDRLTNCFNRSKLMQKINSDSFGEGWDDHSTYNNSFLCIDINNFKHFIDINGLQEGDRVLTAIADKLKSIYSEESVYRVGGDEFVVDLGAQENRVLSIPYDVKLKSTIVRVSVTRNQKRNHHINREILFYIDKGIIESTEIGNEIQLERITSA
jgi:diguanylate cyclase (GGDEF)-like protein